MKKISLAITVVALGLMSWKSKNVEAAPLNMQVYQVHNLLNDSQDSMDTIDKKEIKLKLKPGAGDVAKVKLLSVLDMEGNLILKKFVPNNTKGVLKFKVPNELDSLKIKYGSIEKNIGLKDGIAVFNFREF